MNNVKNDLQEQIGRALLALGKHGKIRVKTHGLRSFASTTYTLTVSGSGCLTPAETRLRSEVTMMNEARRITATALAEEAKELRLKIESLQADEQAENGVNEDCWKLEEVTANINYAGTLLRELAEEAPNEDM